MSTEPNSKTPENAMPVTILMVLDRFYEWLFEVKDITNPHAESDDPDFLIEEMTDPNSPYWRVAAYLNTTEGTVIARHLRHDDQVKVTIREHKPGANLVRTVRDMLGEEGEAA